MAISLQELIQRRISVRAFLPQPVERTTIESIIQKAVRAPSGGNLQPWKIYAVEGKNKDQLVEKVLEKFSQSPMGEGDLQYPIYPEKIKEPYELRRRAVGIEMYELMGITREDSKGRLEQMKSNFEFFGAPVGLFFAIDRQMGSCQWSDVGMLMQNIILLAREQGLETCCQEIWSLFHKTVSEHLQMPAHEILFCGMALGFADEKAPVNKLYTQRAPLSENFTWA